MDEEKNKEESKAEESKKENELVLGYKSFTLDSEKHKPRLDYNEIRIFFPSIGEESEIEDFGARTYNRLLKDKEYLTEIELGKILEERGVWTDKDAEDIKKKSERIDSIKSKIIIAKAEVEDIKELEKNEKYISWLKELTQLKGERTLLIQKRQRYFSNTVESVTEREKLKKKMILCCRYADNTPVWKEMVDINSEPDKVLYYELLYQSLLYWAGLDSSFLERFRAEETGEPDLELQKTLE